MGIDANCRRLQASLRSSRPRHLRPSSIPSSPATPQLAASPAGAPRPSRRHPSLAMAPPTGAPPASGHVLGRLLQPCARPGLLHAKQQLVGARAPPAPAAALLRSSPSPPDPARPCVPSLVPATRSPRRTTGDQQRRRTPCPIPARVRAQETRQVASLQVSSSPVGHQHRAGFLGRSRRVHSRLRQVYIDMLKEQLLDVDTVPGRASSPSPARAASARPRSRARSTRAPRSATTSPYYTVRNRAEYCSCTLGHGIQLTEYFYYSRAQKQ
ncbi:atherin isoform X8 [Triticum aestivum]|uniref:atherin isoform X8 n=1 Tax=Triticum aestivum TaxID=4565 RepID=UPI001D01B92A|nr:atherin-like isoform X8 [Triticum aestivum]